MASTESSSKSASSRGLRNGSGRGGGGGNTRSDRGETRGENRDRGETRGDRDHRETKADRDRGETRGENRDRGETRGDRGENRGENRDRGENRGENRDRGENRGENRDRGETRGPRGNKDSYEPRRGGGGRGQHQHDEGSDRDHHYVGQHQNEGRRGARQQQGGGGGGERDSYYQSDNRRERDDGSFYDSRRGPERGIRVQPPPPPRMRNKVTPHPAAAAAGRISESSYEEHSDKNCIVCYKEVKYYSVGACNHSVCYECSGRMRVLMEQNECPICRQTLEIVIFTKGLKPFKELKDRLRMFILLPQWGLYLEGEDVNRDFEQLLEHRCPYCDEEADTFPTFKDLKRHVQRDHEMYSCDLCSDNIKLFSKERRFYTRQELGTHKRKGDRNDKSHRGHPLCEFCDRRYFDHDELYKHLRKDHYFCHFCDADGYNHYYNTYDDLRLHFRKEHFLCEEENCKEEKFTSVFRTEIDMKAHLTAVHSRLLGKHGTKQARMIDLEFNIKSDEDRRSRRFNGEGFVGRGGGRRERGGDHNHGEDEIDDMPRPVFEPPLHPQPKVDSVADFPMLEGAAAARVPLPVTNGSSHANSSIAQKAALSSGRNVINKQSGGGGGPKWNAKSRQDEEFPALGPNDQVVQPSSRQFGTTTASTVISTKKPPPPVDTQPAKRNGFARPTTLSSALEEFPSLGNPSSANGTAWVGSGVKMKKGKQTPRSLKVAAPPLERKIEVDPYDSFHFVPLSVSRARKDSLTKKYECIIANEDNCDDSPSLTTELDKKKKKNKAISSSNEYPSSPKEKAKAIGALFNGKSPESGATSSKKLSQKSPDDDFPSLEPVKKSSQFSSSPCKKSSPSPPRPNKIAPPPGFGNAAPKSTDLFDLSFLTVTASNPKNHNNNNNISEDLELLKAKAGAVGKLYSQPPEFTRRNGRLLEAIKSSLNGDESSFEMFKSVSNQYRKGELVSKEYYELCQDLFGVTDFRVIFPELVALLPEIEKQQELLASHRRSGGIMKDLSSCHECFQVIKAGDMASHIQSHSAAEVFPAL